MDPDTSLVLGLVLAILSIPAIVSAMSDGRAPRVAALVLIVGCGCMVYALNQKPGGYTLEGLPDTVYRVIGQYLG